MSDHALSHCTFSRTSPLYIPMTNTTSSTKMATNARIITALRNADERARMQIAPKPAAQHTVCCDACKEARANANASMSGESVYQDFGSDTQQSPRKSSVNIRYEPVAR